MCFALDIDDDPSVEILIKAKVYILGKTPGAGPAVLHHTPTIAERESLSPVESDRINTRLSTRTTDRPLP